MSLVDPDLSGLSHVMEVLSGVDTGFQGRGPAGGVDGRSFVFGVCDGLPVDHEGDGVFGLFDAVVGFGGGDTSRCGGDDSGKMKVESSGRRRGLWKRRGNVPSWDGLALDVPAVDVDVVRGKVVRDLHINPGPSAFHAGPYNWTIRNDVHRNPCQPKL